MNKKTDLVGIALTAVLACSTATEEGQKSDIAYSAGGKEEFSFNLSRKNDGNGGQNMAEYGGMGGADDCDPKGRFLTYTQGGWHNAASTMISLGSEGVTVGDKNADYALFNSKETVVAFLPATGTPGALQGQYVNPSTTPAGVLAGQALALTLNVNLNFDGCGYTLDELIVSLWPL